MSVKCLIPAAGKGTRMRPLSHTLPKAMLPVAGKPTIYHIIDRVKKAGVKDFVIITGYLRELMESEILESYPDLKITFVEQKEQKGLGHALYQAKTAFSQDDSILIVYGDTLFEADIETALKSAIPQIGVFEVEDPRRFGIIELEADKKTISKFIEKPENPTTNLTLPGVNYFPRGQELFSALEYIIQNDIKTKNEYQATDAYDYMVREKKVKMSFFKLSAWDDAGTLEAMLQTNAIILKRNGPEISGKLKSQIRGAVHIDPTASLQNCEIGPDVSIGPGVTLIDCTIQSSIIDKNSRLTKCNLKNSIIGRNCDITGINGTVILGDDNKIV